MRVPAVVVAGVLLAACGRFGFDPGHAGDGGADDDDAGGGGDDGGGSAQMDAPSSCTAGMGTFSVLGEQPYALWANGVYNVVWIDHTAAIAQLAFSTVTNDGVKGGLAQVSNSTVSPGARGGAFLALTGSGDHLVTAYLQTESGFTLSVRHAEVTAAGSIVVRDTMDFRDATPSQSISQLFPIIADATGATVLVNDLRSGDFNEFGSMFPAGSGKVSADVDFLPVTPRDTVHDVAPISGAAVLVWEGADTQHLSVGKRDSRGDAIGADSMLTSTNGGLSGIGASPAQIAVAWVEMSTGFISFSRLPSDLSNMATNVVPGSGDIGDTKPSVAWSGDRWVLAWIDEVADLLHVITLDTQGNVTGTLLTTNARSSDSQVGLAANGSSIFVAWIDQNAVSYQLICQ